MTRLAVLIFVQMLRRRCSRRRCARCSGRTAAPRDRCTPHDLNMIGAAFMAPIVGHLSDRRAGGQGFFGALAAADAISSPLGRFHCRTAVPPANASREERKWVGDPPHRRAGGARHARRAHMGIGGAALMPRSPRARRSAARCFASTSPPVLRRCRLGRRGCDLRARLVADAPGAGDGAARPFASSCAGRGLWAPLGAAFAARFSIGCLIVTFALLFTPAWPHDNDHRAPVFVDAGALAAATIRRRGWARGPAPPALGAGAAVWRLPVSRLAGRRRRRLSL